MVSIYFFVGKGGVGKTTCATAFSLTLASRNYRTLIVSLDPAHNLGDVLGLKLGEKEVKVIDNLYAVEVDFDKMVHEHLKQLADKIKEMYRYLKVLNLDKYIDLLKHSPGVEEYATLEKIIDIVEEETGKGKYDVIVFDTPPTGLMIRILALPAITLIWVDKLLELRKAILERRLILERIHGEKTRIKIGDEEYSLPSSISEDPVYRELLSMRKRVNMLYSKLVDKNTTSIVLVVNPETLPVLEAYRAYTFLAKINIPVKALVVNKVLELKQPARDFKAKIREQEKALKMVREMFKDIPVVRVPLLPEEPIGVEKLSKMARYFQPILS